MVAETHIIVTREMTIEHFVAGMPLVYATPVMVLHMEMAAGSAIASVLPNRFISIGMVDCAFRRSGARNRAGTC
jgi:fluoroacetyl-CoA thioesterase